MEAMEAILTRRSIRQFRQGDVSEADVRELLAAAMAAPSAGNEQAWAFIVIRDRALLDAVPAFHPYVKMIYQAPLAILVCGELAAEKHKGFWVQDCAAATQNLLLAAHAKGLGAVWTGVYPDEARMAGCRGLFGLPAGIVPFALIPLGHPGEIKPPEDRFDPSKVKRNTWQSPA